MEEVEGRRMLAAGVAVADVGTAIEYVPAAVSAAEVQVVRIPDDNLLAAVREAVGKPSGTITVDDMASLRSLSVTHPVSSDHAIVSLAGLQYARNLVGLNLWGNAVSDLGPIAGLPKLRSLNLRHNRLADTSVLASLKRLEHLDVSQNGLESLTLDGLGRLSSLDASSNGLKEAKLTNLPALRAATLHTNDLTSVSFSGTPLLQKLDIANNNVADLSPLGNLARLTYLGAQNNEVADIGPLRSLRRLRHLDLASNFVADLTPLKDVRLLHTLYLWDNQIADISTLRSLRRLRYVGIWGNPLRVRAGTPAQQVIASLKARGVRVERGHARAVDSPTVEVYLKREDGDLALENRRETAIDFGTINLGGTPVERRFDIRMAEDGGNDYLQVGTVRVPAGFEVEQTNYRVIPKGSALPFLVRFVGGAPGVYGGVVEFATNDPEGNPFRFYVQGEVAP